MAGGVRKSRLSREVPEPLTDHRDFREKMAKKVQEVRTELSGHQSRKIKEVSKVLPFVKEEQVPGQGYEFRKPQATGSHVSWYS